MCGHGTQSRRESRTNLAGNHPAAQSYSSAAKQAAGGLSHLVGRVSVSTTVCTALFVPLATLCPTFLAVCAVFFATLAAVWTGSRPNSANGDGDGENDGKECFHGTKVSFR